MSSWVHIWGRPHTGVVVGEDRKPLYTARQTCTVCGCTRNPISGAIVRWGRGTWCRDRTDQPDTTGYEESLERVKADLRMLKSAGESVDQYHTGKPDRPYVAPHG